MASWCSRPGHRSKVVGASCERLAVRTRIWLGFAAYAKSYGALTAVVLLLLWLYIWGVMVIVGGQVNATLDRRRRHIVHREKVTRAASPRLHVLVVVDSKQTSP